MNGFKGNYGQIMVAIAIGIVLLCLSFMAYSQITTESNETINATETFSDMAFLAAEDLVISAQSTDDIFAVGSEITVKDAKADHLISAGGEIEVNGPQFKDLILAGGDINLLAGIIEDDVVAAAGALDIKPEFLIKGSAMLAAGDLTIGTPIGGDLRAAGESISLNANVAGDAQLYGENISIGPNVKVGGNLRYRAESFELHPTAEITGSVTKLEKADTPEAFENFGMKAVGLMSAMALMVTIGGAILVCTGAAAFPGLMNNSAKMINEKPLLSAGIGFLVVLVGPTLLVFLLATVLGIPLALLIGALYLAATPLALAAAAYYLGQRGQALIAKTAMAKTPALGPRVGWSFAGIAALIILGLIPVVGTITWLLAYVFGMGAIVTQGGKVLRFG